MTLCSIKPQHIPFQIKKVSCSNGGNSTSNNNKNNRDINRLQQSQQINCHSDTLSLAKVKDKVIVDKQFSAILSKLMDRQLSYLWTNNCLL